MALGWFRRHQKMVMIIMVALMCSFLIGFQGFSSVMSALHLRREPPIGTVGEEKEKVAHSRLIDARNDLQILGASLRMNELFSQGRLSPDFSPEFYFLSKQRDPWMDAGMVMQMGRSFPDSPDAEEAFALLLMEAGKHGITVNSADVEAFLEQMGRPGNKEIRSAVGDWLAIDRMFLCAKVDTPPSETQIELFCRDLMEKIKVRVLEFPADKFLPAVKDANFSPEQINAQFQAFRNVQGYDTLPEAVSIAAENSMGFGYLIPAKVRLNYLLVNRRAIERVARPGNDDILHYYLDHKQEFVVPVQSPTTAGAAGSASTTAAAAATVSGPAATAPALAAHAATGPASAPATRLMTPAEAWPIITRKLVAGAVQSKMDEVLANCRSLVTEYAGSPEGAYKYVESNMVVQGQMVQAALHHGVKASFKGISLKDAVDKLASDAGLAAIVFPYGGAGKAQLDPSLQVTLDANGLTLGEALNRLAEQVKWPKIDWGMCSGFDNVLFPLPSEDAEDLFPIKVAVTPLEDVKTVQKDPILGRSVNANPSSRQTLLQVAFTCKPLGGANGIDKGEDGPVMAVLEDESGTSLRGLLLWRLLDAQGQQVPIELTPDIRKQVIEDLKIRAAFELAHQAAMAVNSPAQLDLQAAKADANVVDTEWFARRALGMQGVQYNPVPPLNLPPNPVIRKAFVDAAFGLAPDKVEPPIPDRSNSVRLLDILPMRTSYVLMRIDGFQPMVRSEFEQQYRPQAVRMLGVSQMENQLGSWFMLRIIAQRVGFVPDKSFQQRHGGDQGGGPQQPPPEEGD